ncbi:MAG: cytochrome c3 family protein [Anaerolineae bacterium]|nr:cytochrome c3 family protein [Anaerolineae bacterium]
MHTIPNSKQPLLIVALGLFTLTLALVIAVTESHAAPINSAVPPNAPMQQATQQATPQSTPEKLSNAYCLLCHAQPNRAKTFPSGETLSLTIDALVLAKSVHGDSNQKGALACADCHTNYRFPHPVQASRTIRDFQLERYATCRNCHEEQYTRNQDSVHGAALRSGRLEAATCVDCHGGHDIQPPDQPKLRISLTCGKCHGAIFDQYQKSVHGKALLTEGNTDVPTCIDCHGVHNIEDPTTALFRVRSPALCSRCHADATLMSKYNISTRVFDTYLTEFHGSTVALFEQQDPSVPTNKAVCYDCHGVHNILSVKDKNAQVVRENLLTTCQQCHPNATANFPDAWVGHYTVTADKHPTLSAANTAYNVLIPGGVGITLVLVGVDFIRRLRQRFSRNPQNSDKGA